MAPSFNPSKDIPSLAGNVILITGGNTGLGKQTIAYLAEHSPARIYLAARTESKALSAIDDIRAAVPAAPIEYLPLDLTSFASIAAAASTFKARESRLDILINNAGVMMTPFQLTKEGYELQLGTNHMGHMLLTKLLLPTLLATAEQQKKDAGERGNSAVRIINVSSLGHYSAPLFSGVVLDPRRWPRQWTWMLYAQSKLANILFTRELAARYPSITSVAVHPGIIYTDLWAAVSSHWLVRWLAPLYAMMFRFLPGHYLDTKAGALNQTWAATVKASRLQNGAYYTPVGCRSSGSWRSRDRGLARRLWEWTDAQFERHGY